MFDSEPILLIFGVILYLYFIAISIRFPMICAAIYPLTFMSFTQIVFSVGGISPSKYLGVPLIFVGLHCLLKELHSRVNRNYSLLALFCLLALFPLWILIRFLFEGSEINLTFTLMLNVLTTFAIVVIVNNDRRKRIMEIGLGATFFLLSLGMIVANYFPSMSVFRSMQEGEYSRTIGLANDPNFGGAFIAIGITYFFSKLVYYYETKRKIQFYLFLLLVIISIVGLAMTLSRAAILSGVVCLLMMALWGRIKFKNIVWSALLMMFFYVLAGQFPDKIEAIVYRFSISMVDYSNISRLETFRQGIYVFENNMVVGIGELAGFHNAFLDAAVSGGIIGLLSFVLPIITVFMMNVKIMTSPVQELQETARFVVCGLFVIAFNGMFIAMEQERIVWFLFGWGIINFILHRKALPVAKPALAFDMQLNLESKQSG